MILAHVKSKGNWLVQIKYTVAVLSPDHSKAVLLLWIFYVFSVLRLLCLCWRLFICVLWSPAGKGLTSCLSFVVSNCELALSHGILCHFVVLDCIDS